MRLPPFPFPSPWLAAAGLLAALLSACGGGGSSSDPTRPGSNGLVAQPASTEGRLLASNCFQCHGTGGMGGFERIRGGEVDEVREYRDLARRPARSDIMAAHAQGYTDAQIAAIVQYLKQ
jgi:mono/diheme cytochrome c family protein